MEAGLVELIVVQGQASWFCRAKGAGVRFQQTLPGTEARREESICDKGAACWRSEGAQAPAPSAGRDLAVCALVRGLFAEPA